MNIFIFLFFILIVFLKSNQLMPSQIHLQLIYVSSLSSSKHIILNPQMSKNLKFTEKKPQIQLKELRNQVCYLIFTFSLNLNATRTNVVLTFLFLYR